MIIKTIVPLSLSVVATVALAACGGGKVEGAARHKQIEALHDRAIKDGRYVEAMCLMWGDGAFSPQPQKFCQCQTRIENSAFPKRKGERESFYKRVLEGYQQIEGTPQDTGFDPYTEQVFYEMQSRIENLEYLVNPAAFDETISQKIEKQCSRYMK